MHVANADQPAIVETYVNSTKLIQIITQEFGEIVASEITEIIPMHLRSQGLNHPYGMDFKALTDDTALGEILKPALIASGSVNEYSKFSNLLTTINKAPVFRGMAHNRQFSGCLSVFLHLKTYMGGIVRVKVSKANPYKGC